MSGRAGERAGAGRKSAGCGADVMWPVLWTVVRTYAPYVTFPVAFVVGAVGYHLEWFIRGKDPQPVEEEKSISERREDRKLDELLGKDHTQVVLQLMALRERKEKQLTQGHTGGLSSSSLSLHTCFFQQGCRVLLSLIDHQLWHRTRCGPPGPPFQIQKSQRDALAWAPVLLLVGSGWGRRSTSPAQ
ncbi:Small integral membrane protein 12 [Manis javanica]|nr:Small integral membrane protein 12 [Manis javanica]